MTPNRGLIHHSELQTDRTMLLRDILLSYAPSHRERAFVYEIWDRMADGRLSRREMELQITSAIQTGLSTGNWFWKYL